MEVASIKEWAITFPQLHLWEVNCGEYPLLTEAHADTKKQARINQADALSTYHHDFL